MKDLILDSTWSYKVGANVFIKGREDPVICYPSRMTAYTDESIKKDFVEFARNIEAAMDKGSGVVYICRQAFQASEIQAISFRITLINEMRSGQRRNDYESLLCDILVSYYNDLKAGANYD